MTVTLRVCVDGIIEEDLVLLPLPTTSLPGQITQLALLVPAEAVVFPRHILPVDLLRVEENGRPLLADQLPRLDLPAGYEPFASPLNILGKHQRLNISISPTSPHLTSPHLYLIVLTVLLVSFPVVFLAGWAAVGSLLGGNLVI